MDSDTLARRNQQVLYDKKWIIFLRRTWPFRFIPFVDFAVAAGSMALGNVNLESDFDVIVGARAGRIFTARFFAVAIFGLLGWRRKKLSHKEAAADKICLNHFITPKTFRLSPPHDKYWQVLYANLVPIFGDQARIADFFAANQDWAHLHGGQAGRERLQASDPRFLYRRPSAIKVIVEKLLSGVAGSWLEKLLRNFQIRRIERSLLRDPSGYKPRIKYNDEELEFHPDTRRIEILDKSL